MKKYSFPVWATQGGGLVQLIGDRYVFVEPPPGFPDLIVGSSLPEQWDLIPANQAARDFERPSSAM
jgi:hypothetical protein